MASNNHFNQPPMDEYESPVAPEPEEYMEEPGELVASMPAPYAADTAASLQTLEKDVMAKGGSGDKAAVPGAVAANEASRLDTRIAAKNAANPTSRPTEVSEVGASRQSHLSALETRINAKGAANEKETGTQKTMMSEKEPEMEKVHEPDYEEMPPEKENVAIEKPDTYHDKEPDEKMDQTPAPSHPMEMPAQSTTVAARGMVHEPDVEFGTVGGGTTAVQEKLAVAELVSPDEDDAFIPAAVEYDPDSKPPLYTNRKFRLYGIVAIVLVVVVIVAVSVSVARSVKKETFIAPTFAPTQSRQTLDILAALEPIVGGAELDFDPELSLEELDSPQAKAAKWIIAHDPRQLTEKDSNLVQRYILAIFYFSTSLDRPWRSCNPPVGDEEDTCVFTLLHPNRNWVNVTSIRWLSEYVECSWAGVICDDKGIVQALDCYGNDLAGTIPVELAELTYIQSIGLFNNGLRGPLPPVLGSLKNLINLELHANALTGSIPTEYWNNPDILRINLGSNFLTGKIPPEITRVEKIKGLFLFDCALSGSIPGSIGDFDALSFLRLQGNKFTGAIPTEFGQLTKLHELFIYNNDLREGIPSELGLLVDLDDLRIQDNPNLGGTIPEELWNLTNLRKIYFWSCSLTGQITSGVGKLTKMYHFIPRKNSFTGAIVPDYVNMPTLRLLWLHFNNFTGPVPDELCTKSPPIQDITADCRAVTREVAKNPCACCYACCDDQCRVVTTDTGRQLLPWEE